MSSPRYPEEFNIEAVKPVIERGLSVAGIAARLGISTHNRALQEDCQSSMLNCVVGVLDSSA